MKKKLYSSIRSRRVLFSLILIAVIAVSAFLAGYGVGTSDVYEIEGSVSILASPDAESSFLSIINSANDTIEAEMYAFTNRNIANALANAAQRGVNVRIIIEQSTVGAQTANLLNDLLQNGVEIRYGSSQYRLTHAKFFIVDGSIAVVGSHNWSSSAMTKNREVSVLFVGTAAESLRQIFERDWLIAALLQESMITL